MLNKNLLHHSYLLEGEKEYIFQELLKFFEKELNFSIQSNPDFWVEDFESLSIDNGRAIKDFQSKKSILGDKKIIVIKTNFISNEAQNSLLKMFEEPTENTHLFLIMPSAENLLPTLISRLNIIKYLNVGTRCLQDQDLLEKFLKANIAKRFEMLKIFLPQKKGEKADKVGAINFLNQLEEKLFNEFKKESKTLDWENLFTEIRKGRSYLNDRSPSIKMILEHIAMLIPIGGPTS